MGGMERGSPAVPPHPGGGGGGGSPGPARPARPGPLLPRALPPLLGARTPKLPRGLLFPPPRPSERNPSWGGGGCGEGVAPSRVPGGAQGASAAGPGGQAGTGAAAPPGKWLHGKPLTAQKMPVLGPVLRPSPHSHSTFAKTQIHPAASRPRSFLGYRGGAAHSPAITPLGKRGVCCGDGAEPGPRAPRHSPLLWRGAIGGQHLVRAFWEQRSDDSHRASRPGVCSPPAGARPRGPRPRGSGCRVCPGAPAARAPGSAGGEHRSPAAGSRGLRGGRGCGGARPLLAGDPAGKGQDPAP